MLLVEIHFSVPLTYVKADEHQAHVFQLLHHEDLNGGPRDNRNPIPCLQSTSNNRYTIGPKSQFKDQEGELLNPSWAYGLDLCFGRYNSPNPPPT